MQYIKIDNDTWIEFDPDTQGAEVLSKAELTDRLDVLQTRLDNLPALPTDEELLVWAKASNQAYRDLIGSRNELEGTIQSLTVKLGSLK